MGAFFVCLCVCLYKWCKYLCVSVCVCLDARVCITDMCVSVWRERFIYFKELALVIMETGNSKICRGGWQSGDPGKS